jgi:hypothetical protein
MRQKEKKSRLKRYADTANIDSVRLRRHNWQTVMSRMSHIAGRRVRLVVLCILLLYGAAQLGGRSIAADSNSVGSAALCSAPTKRQLASGQIRGFEWRSASELVNNDRCRNRLLRVSFFPFGDEGSSWTGGYQVPTGGSLSSQFLISAQVLVHQHIRSFSGVTGSRVSRVEIDASRSGWSAYRPRRPEASASKPLPYWLRPVRIFVREFSIDDRITRVRLRDADGRVLFDGRPTLGQVSEVGPPLR